VICIDIKGKRSFQGGGVCGGKSSRLDPDGRDCIGPDGLNCQKDQKTILFDMK
jgi:hypothetical protein